MAKKVCFLSLRSYRSMLYGGVGAIMGHEVTHGFDVNGKPWFERRSSYLQLSQNTVKHY